MGRWVSASRLYLNRTYRTTPLVATYSSVGVSEHTAGVTRNLEVKESTTVPVATMRVKLDDCCYYIWVGNHRPWQQSAPNSVCLSRCGIALYRKTDLIGLQRDRGFIDIENFPYPIGQATGNPNAQGVLLCLLTKGKTQIKCKSIRLIHLTLRPRS